MDAKLNEMTVAAFSNIEDVKVELLKRRGAAKTLDELKAIDEVLDIVEGIHSLLADLRVQVKKNF
jgi:hypothetical protein